MSSLHLSLLHKLKFLWCTLLVGDERAIEFVAMATRDDLNANAEFIRLADTYVEVPSGSNKVSAWSWQCHHR